MTKDEVAVTVSKTGDEVADLTAASPAKAADAPTLNDYAAEKKRYLDVAPVTGSTVARVFRIARIEFLFMAIGCLASCGEGLMPVVFYWVRLFAASCLIF